MDKETNPNKPKTPPDPIPPTPPGKPSSDPLPQDETDPGGGVPVGPGKGP